MPFDMLRRYLFYAIKLACLIALDACSVLQAAQLSLQIVDQKGSPISNVVVKATSLNRPMSPVVQPVIMDQINKEYVPAVVVVAQGSSVTFPNKDNIKHHVYSFSKAKQFELPLYEGTPTNPVTFDSPGVVVLGCNIHDWMRGYIFVSDSQYTSISDSRGLVTLSDLPADTYHILIWHPQLKDKFEPIKYLLSNQSTKIIELQLKLKPLLKIRRTSNNRRRRYN